MAAQTRSSSQAAAAWNVVWGWKSCRAAPKAWRGSVKEEHEETVVKRRGHMIYWLTSTEDKSKTTTAKSKPSKHLGWLVTLCLLLPLQSPNEWNFVNPEKCLTDVGAVSVELFQVMKFPNAKYCTFPSFQLENCRNADLRGFTWYWYFW